MVDLGPYPFTGSLTFKCVGDTPSFHYPKPKPGITYNWLTNFLLSNGYQRILGWDRLQQGNKMNAYLMLLGHVLFPVLMVGTGKSRWHQPIGQSWYKHRIRSQGYQWYFGLKRIHKQCNWMFSSCRRSVVLNGKCTAM
ncbi:hypothetical protein HanXRQr2_Chr16g0725471 [Helianthus annuus]|uniref:Uncharacterized protein n=1 Tax=Helianthus annuus TaxID=4232 RepID=A0A9K3DMQ1_HELAN|nr:hypothetical protein HanXRQr2_Chr16g0725471 [Helianthus annuus]